LIYLEAELFLYTISDFVFSSHGLILLCLDCFDCFSFTVFFS